VRNRGDADDNGRILTNGKEKCYRGTNNSDNNNL
jgi:hypothetical protein